MTSSTPTASPDHERQVLSNSVQDLVLATEDVENFLQQLADVAAGSAGAEICAGITVFRDGHPATVASSSAEAARYDEVQYGHDAGPCLTALRTGEIVLIRDLAQDERFGEYRPHALAMGLRSALSLPLAGGDDAVGALNLYSRDVDAFGETEQREGLRFAGEASRALRLAVRLAKHTELTEQLSAALTSRAVIDQATGVIMAQNRCSPQDAFAILRSASQHRNVKLRVVAEEIVASISPEPAPET